MEIIKFARCFLSVSDRSQKWGRLFKWIKIKQFSISFFFFLTFLNQTNLQRDLFILQPLLYLYRDSYIDNRRKYDTVLVRRQQYFSQTKSDTYLHSVLTTPALFECTLAIHSYIWILTLLLHTFFPPPKYSAVEPENKHSLKSQIKLPRMNCGGTWSCTHRNT